VVGAGSELSAFGADVTLSEPAMQNLKGAFGCDRHDLYNMPLGNLVLRLCRCLDAGEVQTFTPDGRLQRRPCIELSVYSAGRAKIVLEHFPSIPARIRRR